jgi:tetratricopeptide (TPR) repeat protein
MTKVIVGGMLLALSATALVPTAATAQQTDGIASRVIGSLPNRYVAPDCKMDGGGDFRVSSAKVYLRTGIETAEPANRTNALKNGDRVLREAIVTNKQDKNPSAWYFLGRINLQQGDIVGADSTLRKAEELAPACKADIRQYRYRAYAALVTGAQELQKNGQSDSSALLLKAANRVETSLPMAHILLAEVYSDKKQTDSAMAYFGKAAATDPTDPNQQKYRNQAAFNYGVMLLDANRPAEAITAFRRYLTFEPNDNGGKNGIARAFRAANLPDSAKVYESQLTAASGEGGADVSEADLFDIAVKQYSDKDYKAAAETFNKIVTRNPNNRDALYNLANTYYSLNDGPNLAKTAEQLIAIEPLAENDHKLRVAGYKAAGNADMQYKAVVSMVALPMDVKVTDLAPSGSSMTLTATATGREALDESNKAIPAKPTTLTFEFLDRTGAVAATTDVTVPALKAGQTHSITATGAAAGIAAWRYKVKS